MVLTKTILMLLLRTALIRGYKTVHALSSCAMTRLPCARGPGMTPYRKQREKVPSTDIRKVVGKPLDRNAECKAPRREG